MQLERVGGNMSRSFAVFTGVLLLLNFAIRAEDDPSRIIKFQLFSRESSGLLADIFAGRSLQIPTNHTIACNVSVLRPRMGMPALTSRENVAECVINDDLKQSIKWNLNDVEVSAWGNRFSPKGFSLKGRAADDLYLAMEKIHSRANHSGFLEFRHLVIPSPAFVMDYDEYAIVDESPEFPGEKIAPLNCTRYYYYAPNESRPENPSEIRCDFVYQWHVIEGDTF